VHDQVNDDRSKTQYDHQLFEKRNTNKFAAFTCCIFLNFHPSEKDKKQKSNIADNGKF
jgi:hypothetical protein